MPGSQVSSFKSHPESESLPGMRSHCSFRGAASRQQDSAGREDMWHQPRLGHHTTGYTAIPRDRRVLFKQGVLHLGWGGIPGGTSSQVGYEPRGSQGFCGVQGSVRLHQVLRHRHHGTRLSHKARAKVLGHQSPAIHPKIRSLFISPVPYLQAGL